MAFLSSMNIVGSGLTAQQLRLDVISENITNQNTTRTENGGPYRRKMVVLESQDTQTPFQQALARARGEAVPGLRRRAGHRDRRRSLGLQAGVRSHQSGRQCRRLCGDAQCGSGQRNGRCHVRVPGIFRQCHRFQCAQAGDGQGTGDRAINHTVSAPLAFRPAAYPRKKEDQNGISKYYAHPAASGGFRPGRRVGAAKHDPLCLRISSAPWWTT